jgi:cold shock CspA family protein
MTTVREQGCVKWFKDGYGFISLCAPGASESDVTEVFVHHSALRVQEEQYRYLVPGEYVELAISATTGEKHKVQASEVSGIQGGRLMCETRRLQEQSQAQRPARVNTEVRTAPKQKAVAVAVVEEKTWQQVGGGSEKRGGKRRVQKE